MPIELANAALGLFIKYPFFEQLASRADGFHGKSDAPAEARQQLKIEQFS